MSMSTINSGRTTTAASIPAVEAETVAGSLAPQEGHVRSKKLIR
jgi:hypothetical protein